MDRIKLLMVLFFSLFLIIMSGLIYCIYSSFNNYESMHPEVPPCGTIFEEPLQQYCSILTICRTYNGVDFEIEPVATYNITATVKSKSIYHDEMSSIVPIDMVLVWGKLEDADVDGYITYNQYDRKYQYRYMGGCPVSGSYIQSHSSNTHIIPSNDAVNGALGSLARDRQITMGGYLVDVYWTSGGGLRWIKTSRIRTDSGMGSCEVFFVDSVTIGNETYT
ncbi:hypothetical protein CUJ83_03935 [Methanocella sp. CWC-04]|uniref:Uncharacterized protein n=1 Tax=Methanooceanicella nereidis TaxID=2052831 RepID=A0AAP2RB92_9EURY|nr:hypothetical protein [Methanocella sp. CWC-04]MCD1294143.1 hypothetical protein [Methanocella sp. CWC-04]